jgi:hypothetical protein
MRWEFVLHLQRLRQNAISNALAGVLDKGLEAWAFALAVPLLKKNTAVRPSDMPLFA